MEHEIVAKVEYTDDGTSWTIVPDGTTVTFSLSNNVADQYPVFATEIGFMSGDDPGAHVPVISDETYGRRVTEYFAKKGISWTAWCFDPDWPAQLISDWDYTPTKQGEFFRSQMLKKR